jgi:hypothetical protein
MKDPPSKPHDDKVREWTLISVKFAKTGPKNGGKQVASSGIVDSQRRHS